MRLPVILHLETDQEDTMLIDSGASGNFIDPKVVENLKIPLILTEKPVIVRNVDGTENSKGRITHFVELKFSVAGRLCTLEFLVTGLGSN